MRRAGPAPAPAAPDAPRARSVEIIANSQGNRTTPSYVAFTDSERLVGDAALNQVATNPRNTVFDAKRLIGRKFNDPTVQADMRHWRAPPPPRPPPRPPALSHCARPAGRSPSCPPPTANPPSSSRARGRAYPEPRFAARTR